MLVDKMMIELEDVMVYLRLKYEISIDYFDIGIRMFVDEDVIWLGYDGRLYSIDNFGKEEYFKSIDEFRKRIIELL